MNLISLYKIKSEDRGLTLHNGINTLSCHLRELIAYVTDSIKNNPLMVICAIRHTLRKIWAIMESNKKPTSRNLHNQFSNQDALSSDSKASYYYILHHYLSKLLECPQIHNPNYIKKLGFTSLLHLLLGHKNHDIENHSVKKLLAIFEYPIKTLVLLSRAQLHANPKKKLSNIQKSLDMELDKEVFNYCYLVQIMLSIFHPDQALNTIMNAYGLQNWLNPNLNHSIFSEQEHFYMAGDFIKLLLHCFTDRDEIAGSDFDIKAIKTLALYIFQPKDEAFLMQFLPHWLTHSPHYTQKLLNMTGFDFSPEQRKLKYPLKLNPDFAHWVNPYHYFIKQKDFLAARLVRKTHDDPTYYAIHMPSFPSGTFQNIWAFFHCPLLTKIIFYTLLHIKQSTKNQDVLADCLSQLFAVARTEFGNNEHTRNITPVKNIWSNAYNLTFHLNDGKKSSCYELLKTMKTHQSFSQITEKYDDILEVLTLVGPHY